VAVVRPFRALRYDTAVAGPLSSLVAPPYDVIGAEEREELRGRNPFNVVHLTLPDSEDEAGSSLAEWRAEGVLVRDAEPACWWLAQEYVGPDGVARRREGFVAALRIEPYSKRVVLPHERTHAGPKEGRLRLLRATRTQLEPLFFLWDGTVEVDGLGEPDLQSGGDSLWRLDADFSEALVDELAEAQLLIADGHHRYETALAYQAEVRADPTQARVPAGELAADWVMMVLVNAELEELRVLPTHRLLRGVDEAALERLARGEVDPWRSSPLTEEEILAVLDEGDDEPVFGLLLPGKRSFILRIDRVAAAERMRRERVSTTVAKLDLAVLHAALLDDVLTVSTADVAAGERLTYTRSAAEARSAVESGDVQAAILVRPTSLEEIAAVASAGDVMPQKSTYFYPKLLTGMAFNPVEG